MQRLADLYCKLLCALMALGLAAMVVLVFGNVVLRYAFNSSITVSEELGRWLFVWITFLGAVVALREHAHLGTDLLTSRLPPAGRKACLLATQLVMLYICWLVFKGSLEQTRINLEVLAPSTQWSMGIVYAAGVVFAVSAAAMLLIDLALLLTGRAPASRLGMSSGTQEALHAPGGRDADPPAR